MDLVSSAQGVIGVSESVAMPEEPKEPAIDRTKRPFKKHYKVLCVGVDVTASWWCGR